MMNRHSQARSNVGQALFENGIEKRPEYLTSAQLAAVLRISEHTVRKWRKLRIITPEKFRGSVRWLLEDVLQELKAGERNEKS